MNKKLITVASTLYGHSLKKNTNKYSGKDIVDIALSKSIFHYSLEMGGFDHLK